MKKFLEWITDKTYQMYADARALGSTGNYIKGCKDLMKDLDLVKNKLKKEIEKEGK